MPQSVSENPDESKIEPHAAPDQEKLTILLPRWLRLILQIPRVVFDC
jgi:hypothetical protein